MRPFEAASVPTIAQEPGPRIPIGLCSREELMMTGCGIDSGGV
jgi:hypothetical protein